MGFLHFVYPWHKKYHFVHLKKYNFDGAVFEDSGEARIGDVIRNSGGNVLASLSKRIPNSSSVATLELLEPKRAAMFVQEVGIGNSIFEGDYEVIIKALDQGNWLHYAFDHSIKGTLSFVNSY